MRENNRIADRQKAVAKAWDEEYDVEGFDGGVWRSGMLERYEPVCLGKP